MMAATPAISNAIATQDANQLASRYRAAMARGAESSATDNLILNSRLDALGS